MGRDNSSWVQTLALATTIPMVLVVGPLLGYWVGAWVDRHRPAIAPWGVGVSVIVGLLASGRQAWQLIRQIQSVNQR